jgi:protein-S-isoprenylcysteine O-methyltransferase Ste14
MDGNTSLEQLNEKSRTTGVVMRWLVYVAVLTAILGASLFISSGRLNWVMAWAYLGVSLAGQCVIGLILIPNNPELVAERTRIERDTARAWDRPLTGIVSLFGPVATLIVAGLDVRFSWSPPIQRPIQLVALAVAVLGTFLTDWAMASNRFFYGFVRIRKDRGHTVATGGPYRAVRHPGYAGAILFALATPLLLGALWAFIPAGLTVCAFIVRTALEDKTLQDELDGYKDYTQQTRYRLLPGVW